MNTLTIQELTNLLQVRRQEWEKRSKNGQSSERDTWWKSLLTLDSSENLLCDLTVYDREDLARFIFHYEESPAIPRAIRDSRNNKNQSILHLAVLNSSYRILAVLQEMFNREEDEIFWNDQTLWGETALHLASGVGDVKIVGALLGMKCDESKRDKWGRTAADIAEETGHSNLFAGTILSKKYLTEKAKNQSTNFLLQSSQSRHLLSEEFLNAVRRKKASYDGIAKEVKVKTIFNEAIESFSTDHQNGLVDPVGNGRSLFVSTISKMLEYPGDPVQLSDLCGEENWTKYDINGYDFYGLAAIHKIASWDKVDLLEIILRHPQVEINKIAAPSQECFTALHFAIDNHAINTFQRLLLVKDINLAVPDRKGRTPIQFARVRGLEPFISLIQNSLSSK